MSAAPLLRIGTRGSPLALAQAEATKRALAAAHPDLAEPDAVTITVIRTTGDAIRDRPLSESGGKGLFTKEIEEALLAGSIDLAVHSMKDMPTRLPDGLAIAAIPMREDPRDALFIAPGDGGRAARLADLPAGVTLGTAALRRRAQLLHLRPDVSVELLRGNVGTRLDKLARGEFGATLLALAGLRRLGLDHLDFAVIGQDEMLPAVAQGALCLETRTGDDRVLAYLAPLEHRASALAVHAERALLDALDGSCRTPIAALATIDDGGGLTLDALVAKPDGSVLHRLKRRGSGIEGVALGREVGAELRSLAGPGFLDAWQ